MIRDWASQGEWYNYQESREDHMKATIILEDAPEELVKRLINDATLIGLGAKFKVTKVKKPKPAKNKKKKQ